MAVYIIKFSAPLGSDHPKGRAQYYVGYTRMSIRNRLKVHRAGYGAAITRAAVQKGLTLNIVWTSSKGSRQLEREIKSWKSVRGWLRAHPQRANRAHKY